jgi:hypothetical protein
MLLENRFISFMSRGMRGVDPRIGAVKGTSRTVFPPAIGIGHRKSWFAQLRQQPSAEPTTGASIRA